MARTKRTIPNHAQGKKDWTPTWHNPRGLKVSQMYEHGLMAFEISSSFRGGRLDEYSTATTGGKSTHRVKQKAGKQRRLHEKRVVREHVAEV